MFHGKSRMGLKTGDDLGVSAVDIPVVTGMIDSDPRRWALFMNRRANLLMLLATDSQKYFFLAPLCLRAFHAHGPLMETGTEHG
jgi:hypothetical protein